MLKNRRKLTIIIVMILLLIFGMIGTTMLKENTVKSTLKGTISNFEASDAITKTINGIKYQIDSNNNSATILQIEDYDNATCTFNPGNTTKKATFCINIPESIGYSTNNVTTRYATVKYVGDGSNGIFGERIKSHINIMNAEQLVMIFNKSITEVRTNAITGYGSITIGNLRLVALSNDIEFKAGSITTKANLPVKVVAVPGTKTDAVKNVSGVSIISLYDVEKNTTNKTVTIKGFNSGNTFQDTCDANSGYIYDKNAVLVNVKFPEKMTIDGTEYTVTGIGYNAFGNSQRLKNVIVPTTINTLQQACFAGCTNLRNLWILNKNANIAQDILYGSYNGNSTANSGNIVKNKINIGALPNSTAGDFYNNRNSIDSIWFNQLTISSLTVKKMPTKINYKVGESINTSGLELNAIFNGADMGATNGTITKGYNISPTVLNTAGKQTITVAYEGSKTTFTVNVEGGQSVEQLGKVTLEPTAQGRSEIYLGKDYNLYLDSSCTSKMTASTNGITIPTKQGYWFKGYGFGAEGAIIINRNGYLNEEVDVSTMFRESGNRVLTAQWENLKLSEITLEPSAQGRTAIYLGKDYNLYLDVSCTLKMTPSENKIVIPTKSGYIFTGYGFGEEGATIINENGYLVEGINGNIMFGESGNRKLTARWTKTVPVEGITLKHTEFEINTGGIEPNNRGNMWQLSVIFTPENATNKNVTYQSNDESIARVNANGVVIGVSPGKTTITVKTEDGNKTATAKVGVVQSAKGITLNQTEKTMKLNESFKLVATVTPDSTVNKDVKWESEKESIAKIDSSGNVTAVGIGETRIIATTSNGIHQAICKIIVKENGNNTNNSGERKHNQWK